MCATTVRDGCSGKASEDYVDGPTIRTILPQQAHRATGPLTGVLAPTPPRVRCGPVRDSDGLPEWECVGAMPEMRVLVGEEVGNSLKEGESYYAWITHL